MCLVCESFEIVERRFESLQGEVGHVAVRFGGDEEELAQVLAFVFYGHEMSQHEREQVWRRALHMGGGYLFAIAFADGTPLEMTGSAYLCGFAHGMKFKELKQS